MLMLAIDSETYLIGGEHGLAPKPVCWSFCKTPGDPHLLAADERCAKLINTLILDDDVTLIGQNIAFDINVAIKHHNVPIEAVFDKYDKGLIKDTGIRQKLLDLGTGYIIRNPKNSLAALIKRYFKEDISASKGEDAWRMRYAELDGVAIEDYPEEAARYAKDDADWTLKVFRAQEEKFRRSPQFQVDEQFQTRAAFDLSLIALHSPRVDQEAVKVFESRHREVVEQAQGPLLERELLYVNKNRFTKFPKDDPRRSGISERQAALREAVRADADEQGYTPLKTPSGNALALSADALKLCHDKDLKQYGEAKTSQKLLNSFVPMLKTAGEYRVTPYYDTLKKTGRTSCVKGDTPVLVRSENFEPSEKEIKDIQIGDFVWTHKRRWRRVTATLVREPQEMFTVTFTDGRELTCTAEHRLLDSESKWVFVGSYINEHLKIVDPQQNESTSSESSLCRTMHWAQGTNTEKHSETVRYDATKCDGGMSNNIYSSREENASFSSVGCNQTRLSESYVGEEGKQTPSLHRGLRRWKRLQDQTISRQANIHAQGSDDGSLRIEEITSEHGRASYRREQAQQRAGQLSFMYEKGSFFSGESDESAYGTTSIEMASDAGLFKVYDITVEEDESYTSTGVFNHNCSLPNLQQLPRSGGARECFIPAQDGRVFVCSDFDAFEMAALAQVFYEDFGKTPLMDAINAGQDVHCVIGARLVGESYDDFYSQYLAEDPFHEEVRQATKAFNFGAPGGMSAPTFIKTLSPGVKDTIAKLQPGVQLEQTVSQYLLEWRDTWDCHAFFRKVGDYTKSGSTWSYKHPFTGRIRAQLGYCDGLNIQFQGRCADAAKLAMQELNRFCYVGRQTYQDVELSGFFHDEFMFEGPEHTVKDWAAEVTRIMCEQASIVIPDVNITAGAQVMDRWRKKGIPLENYDHEYSTHTQTGVRI